MRCAGIPQLAEVMLRTSFGHDDCQTRKLQDVNASILAAVSEHASFQLLKSVGKLRLLAPRASADGKTQLQAWISNAALCCISTVTGRENFTGDESQ